MRRFSLALIMIFVFAAISCNKLKKPAENTADEGKLTLGEASEQIYAGRIGSDREIISFDSTGKDLNKLYEQKYDAIATGGNRILIYKENSNKKSSFVNEFKVLDLNGRVIKTFTTMYRLFEGEEPAVNDDGSVFAFMLSVNGNKTIWYINSSQEEPHQIKGIKGDIRDVSFFDRDTLLYSKKESSKANYQIYKYSISKDKEEKVLESNYEDRSPELSPDKKKISFLRFEANKYVLYVLDLAGGEKERAADRENGVKKQTVKWSQDNNFISYVVEDKNIKKLRLYDVRKNKASDLSDGYISDFSPDGRYVVYAQYEEDKVDEKVEPKQVIYIKDIYNNKQEKVIEIKEQGPYCTSIFMLLWSYK